MANATAPFDRSTALSQLESAAEAGKLSAGAIPNIRAWLTEDRYAAYASEVAEHLASEQWQALDDAFWTIIPFGTGGRRGRMYPIGSNAINDRTIGESAQGLADYVRQQHSGTGELSCAIAYDTRHNSRHFAELCSSIMVAAGFKVYFLDDYRSTPELSFLVRYKNCSCGIMVTASHNPPSDNAVKVYWSTGGQVMPPHDKQIIDRVMSAEEIKTVDFQQAVDEGNVIICTEEVDAAFLQAVQGQSTPGPRDLEIIYSPLHGVGASAVCPVLEAAGFPDVELYARHAELSGDFPNVPGHSSNPENVAVFDEIIERAQEVGADVILASDPDCDRLGVAAPLTLDTAGPWATLNGNQIGALMGDYVLEQKKSALTPEHFVLTTLVTTEMTRRIAESYGVRGYNNLHVGFKWIGGKMDDFGADKFVFGTEESHGYLVGQYARDKDGAVASMLMAELAARCKADGKSLHEKLDDLFWQHGYHAERLVSVYMEGSDGMKRMEALMEKLRKDPPSEFAGIPVAAIRDYASLTRTPLGGEPEPIDAPSGNMILMDLAEEGNYVAVRPSGTEPKVKFYMFTFVPAEQLSDLDETKQQMSQRLDALAADLRAVSDSV